MLKLILLFAVAENVYYCSAFDRALFKQNPPILTEYNVHKLMGAWFIQYHLPPCSWKGSEEFTNFVMETETDPDAINFTGKLHWRMGNDCVRDVPVGVEHKGEGHFFLSDRMGDVITGEKTLACLEHNDCAVYWGCTMRVVNSGTCLDPYMLVATLERVPSNVTMLEIEADLKRLWDMSLLETIPVPQEEAKCCKPKPAEVYGHFGQWTVRT